MDNLQLKNDKTEFLVFASDRQRHKVTSTGISVDGIRVKAADNIKYMGMWRETSLTTKKQVATVCRLVSRNMSLIRYNMKYLSLESCQKLATGLFITIFNYGNTLHFGLPDKEIKKLYRLQIYAAKTILERNRNDHSTLARYRINWLPLEQRIKFKILTLVYKVLNEQAPPYFWQLVEYQDWDRSTRWSIRRLLKMPQNERKTFLDKSFVISGQRMWNELLSVIKEATILESFRHMLRNHLFKRIYNTKQWFYIPKFKINCYSVFAVKCCGCHINTGTRSI